MVRIFLFMLVLVSCSLPVVAHKPLDTKQPATKEQPITVHAHQQSWVAYNRLTASKDVDYYLLPKVQKGDPIDATILIPAIERLKEYKPVIVLLGPGLPVETASLSPKTIDAFLKIAPGEGVVVKTSERDPEIFFEPFTQTKYWRRQSLQLTAPVSGQYYLAVFALNGKADKYVLSIGKEESWKLEDIIKIPRIWWQVRRFAEQGRLTMSLWES